MKTIKYLAIIIAFLSSFSAQAVCPTQQTTIFFANGVNVDYTEAQKSMVRLYDELKKDARFRTDCVRPDLSYNTNEFFLNDFVQAIIQKTAEKTGVDNFPWDKWLHPENTADWFEAVVQDALFTPARLAIAGGRWIFGDQRDEHILAYQAELALGRKIILASHSQGTINSKEERLIMSPTEKSNVNIVAAAAFSLPEPDGTKYTTIDRDNLTVGGGGIYTTPEPNIFLTIDEHNECFQDIIPSFPFLDCHGFLQTYMRIPRSRDKYVNDIIAALPPPPVTPSGVQYLRLATGNPGIPGDGVFVTATSSVVFSPEPPFSLQGITNGITVSVFPPSDIPIQNLFVQVQFTAQNTPTCSGITGGVSFVSTPLVNGVGGRAAVISQSLLNSLVAFIRTQPDCGTVSLADFSVGQVSVFNLTSNGTVVLSQLDAIAVGIGENVFPTNLTPAP